MGGLNDQSPRYHNGDQIYKAKWQKKQYARRRAAGLPLIVVSLQDLTQGVWCAERAWHRRFRG